MNFNLICKFHFKHPKRYNLLLIYVQNGTQLNLMHKFYYYYTLHLFMSISIKNSNKTFQNSNYSINEFKAHQVHVNAVTQYPW